MGCRILEAKTGEAVFYCSTSDWAFGPVMDNYEEAEEFLKWLKVDPRQFKDSELESKYCDFRLYKERHDNMRKG